MSPYVSTPERISKIPRNRSGEPILAFCVPKFGVVCPIEFIGFAFCFPSILSRSLSKSVRCKKTMKGTYQFDTHVSDVNSTREIFLRGGNSQHVDFLCTYLREEHGKSCQGYCSHHNFGQQDKPSKKGNQQCK